MSKTSLDRKMVLGGLFKRIGNFNVESFTTSFEERLIFQKTIYLLQTFDLSINYNFSWYLRGPYSTGLTRMGYELVKTDQKEIRLVKFVDSAAEKRFQRFQEFIGRIKRNAKELELLASIHFIKKIYPNFSREQVIANVRERKSQLRIKKCLKAWDYLEKYSLVEE